MSGQFCAPVILLPEKLPDIHYIGNHVKPRPGLDELSNTISVTLPAVWLGFLCRRDIIYSLCPCLLVTQLRKTYGIELG
jgi:hypothetical protein